MHAPEFAALIGISAAGLVVLVTGWSLQGHSQQLARRAIDGFNRDAAAEGCRDPPLLR